LDAQQRKGIVVKGRGRKEVGEEAEKFKHGKKRKEKDEGRASLEVFICRWVFSPWEGRWRTSLWKSRCLLAPENL
jgi:hypothetical protein